MRNLTRSVLHFIFLLLVGFLTACGGGSGGSEDAPEITAITISPNTVDPVTNSEVALEIAAEYSDGSTQNITDGIEWESSDSRVATISSAGVVSTSNIANDVTIIATFNGITASTTLNIKPSADAIPSAITIPENTNLSQLEAGDELTVQASYDDGSIVEDLVIVVRNVSESAIHLSMGDSHFEATVGNDVSSYAMTELPTNTAPTIDEIDELAGEEGVLFALDVDASDVNASDSLRFSVSNAPQGMTINPATGLINWTPTVDQAGAHSITVAVTDNGIPELTAAEDFSITVVPVDRQGPSMPVNVVATVSSDTEIGLSWTPSTDNGGGNVAGYKIFVNGNAEPVAIVNGEFFSHTGLAPRGMYRYVIVAYDDASPSNESAPSDSVSATTTDTVAPTVPINLIATVVSDNQIDLSWNDSSEIGGGKIGGYKIFVIGSETPIATVVDSQFSHTGLNPRSTYSYTVSAFDDANPINASVRSVDTSATTSDTQAPSIPADLVARVVSDNQIVLSWSASTENVGGQVAGYNIYLNADPAPFTTVTETSFSHAGLEARTNNTYTVTAFDDAAVANESDKSTAADVTTTDTQRPTAPADVVATAVSDTQIDLSWTASTDLGNGVVDGYNIYLDGETAPFASVTETRYSHTNLKARTTHAYTVTAFDDLGNESEISLLVSAMTPDIMAPTAPIYVGPNGKANLIPDPSFEAGTKYWRIGDDTMGIVSSPTHSGSKALKLVHVGDGTNVSGTHETGLVRIGGVVAGQEYIYSVWVSGENAQGVGGGGKPLGIIRFRDGTGEIIKNGEGSSTETYVWAPYGTYGYTKIQIAIQAPTGAKMFDALFRTWWDNTGGETYWDDVSLAPRQISGLGKYLATYQVEQANTKSGGDVKHIHTDYTGTGYYDMHTRGIIEWTNVPGGGDRILRLRYSWEGAAQPIELFVNGVSQGVRKPMATGRRGVWASMIWTVNLPAVSNNVIRFKSGVKGGEIAHPLFDKLDVHSVDSGDTTNDTTTTTNSKPSLNAFSSQTVTEGDLMTVAVEASDSDSAGVSLSQTNTLPATADETKNILTDFGNGVGEISWTPSVGDANGSTYSVTVTATDTVGAKTSRTFSVTVNPMGGSYEVK